MDYEKMYNEALERARALRQEAIDKEYVIDYVKDYETIFPELAESEDERIRKQLIDAIKIGRSNSGISFTEEAASRYIAWLEKQKEQKPMYNLEIPAGDVAPAEEDEPFDEDDFLENELSAFLQNYDKEYDDDPAVSDVARHFYEIGKKQKEHQFCSDAPKEKSVGGIFYSSHKDKNLDEIAQDYVDGVKKYNSEPTWDLMQTAVCYGANWQKEQFEKNRLANCDALSKEEYDRETDFAMEIIEKEHRQPTFNDAINYGMRLQKEQKPWKVGTNAYFTPEQNPKWSDEDEKMLKCCLIAINHYEKTCNIGDHLPTKFNIYGYLASVDKVKSWLKSLRPSWKPSEEQMKELNKARRFIPYNCDILESLHDQLKKL